MLELVSEGGALAPGPFGLPVLWAEYCTSTRMSTVLYCRDGGDGRGARKARQDRALG